MEAYHLAMEHLERVAAFTIRQNGGIYKDDLGPKYEASRNTRPIRRRKGTRSSARP
jgi:hypothetical protein